MNIVLTYISGCHDRSDPYISLLPVGLCSLQAYLYKAGYDAELANLSAWSQDHITEYFKRKKPDLVGISVWTHNRHQSIELVRLIKKIVPDAFIIAGGAHASFQYHEMLNIPGKPFDAVVIGEGEETLLELVKYLDSGKSWDNVAGIAALHSDQVFVTPQRKFLQNLDELPFSSSRIEYGVGVDKCLQAEFLISTRGCPSACNFCSSPTLWSRKVRFRSAISMVDEIEYIRDKYGLLYFSIRDDTFTVDRNRTIEFCRHLIARRLFIIWNCQSRVTTLDYELLIWMKRAGCECIQLGVESGSPSILKKLGKTITPEQVEIACDLIRRVGINLSIYLISDIPGESESDLHQTLNLIRKMHADDGYVSPLAYFPGTQLFKNATESGIVTTGLFMENRSEALFVSEKPNYGRRLLQAISRSRGHKNRQLFMEQKELLHYCATTNVIAGEWYRQNLKYDAAEAEFKEISEQDPDNPWGAFLLAELLQETGRVAEAKKHYMDVLKIVPKHQGSLDGLKKIE